MFCSIWCFWWESWPRRTEFSSLDAEAWCARRFAADSDQPEWADLRTSAAAKVKQCMFGRNRRISNVQILSVLFSGPKVWWCPDNTAEGQSICSHRVSPFSRQGDPQITSREEQSVPSSKDGHVRSVLVHVHNWGASTVSVSCWFECTIQISQGYHSGAYRLECHPVPFFRSPPPQGNFRFAWEAVPPECSDLVGLQGQREAQPQISLYYDAE